MSDSRSTNTFTHSHIHTFVVLVSDIPHPEQQGGEKGDDHDNHRPLHVDGVAHMAAAAGDGLGGEGEGVESLVGAAEPGPFALGLDALEPLGQARERSCLLGPS